MQVKNVGEKMRLSEKVPWEEKTYTRRTSGREKKKQQRGMRRGPGARGNRVIQRTKKTSKPQSGGKTYKEDREEE